MVPQSQELWSHLCPTHVPQVTALEMQMAQWEMTFFRLRNRQVRKAATVPHRQIAGGRAPVRGAAIWPLRNPPSARHLTAKALTPPPAHHSVLCPARAPRRLPSRSG